MKAAEKRRSGKEVGIPEGEVAVAQLPESEIPPVEKLGGDVRMGRGEYPVASGKEDIAEHEQGEDGKNGQCPGPGEGREDVVGTVICRFMIHVVLFFNNDLLAEMMLNL